MSDISDDLVLDITEHFKQKNATSTISGPDLYKILEVAPYKELINRNWISSDKPIADLYNLVLNYSNSLDSGYLFKRTSNATGAQVELWVSRILHKAKEVFQNKEVPQVNLQEIDKDFLNRIAKLSADIDNLHIIADVLLEKGIILILEPHLKGMRMDGVTAKLFNKVPVVAISLRFSRLDNFWFTLLHELSHISLHFEEMESLIVEDLELEPESKHERQANTLAKYSFVSRRTWGNCAPRYDRSEKAIKEYAEKEGVHPVIIAGLLSRELNNYEIFGKLLHSINVRKQFEYI